MTNNKEKELTIKELEAAVKRKKLKEELAKKANKQTRDFDESMLGVCHTCHVPIYYGEPIHKLETREDEVSYQGVAGGGYVGSGSGGAGGIGWKGGKKSHAELEGWIQCGFCYESWKEEKEKVDKWLKGWCFTGPFLLVPIPTFWLGWKLWDTDPLMKVIFLGIGSLIIGYIAGVILTRIVKGRCDINPDRYKKRKNPYRETLIWKLDNEGNPIKEGSMKVNKFGMILDPERDNVNKNKEIK